MKKITIAFLIFILIFSGMNFIISKPLSSNIFTLATENSIDSSVFNKPQESQILENLNKFDGFFTENRGQVGNDSVKYYIQGKGVWFLDDSVVFEIRENIKVESRESRVESQESKDPFYANYHEFENANLKPMKSVVLKLNFERANKVIPEGRGLLPYRSNFFYGNASSKWCTNVENYCEIVYKNLYKNIDLRYYTSDKGLKYDFIVHPGGDPDEIRIRYEGAQELYIDSIGNLRIQTPLGDIIDSGLFIYQNINNIRHKIEGKFNILNSMIYRFEISGKYNSNKAIIIDPLVYSTFIGGINEEVGCSLALDSNNNAYITGWTESMDFPNTTGSFNNTHNGNEDIFVLKLNPTGSSLIYSTFIGGTAWDNGFEIAIDPNGNAYITGCTNSSDFPSTAGAYDTTYNGGPHRDVFVLKLNSTGSSLWYSTFVGGTWQDYGYSIAIDSSGNAYVTGWTNSSNFPNTTGAYDTTYNGGGHDAFVFKLNSTGSSILYSTFIGGSNADQGVNIAIDFNDNVYICGYTESIDFPNTTNAYDKIYNGKGDVFVFKLNPTGSSLLYSTFIGGSNGDRGYSITIDSSNNAYVTGYTRSFDFPNTTSGYNTTYNGWETVYVLKLNPTGSSLIYSIIIGGSKRESGLGIAIDSSGNAYVTGWTDSIDFPTTPGAYDTTLDGSDAFVLKLDPTGSMLLNSTYIGGSIYEYGKAITIDFNCNVYVTGCTGSNNFPITTKTFDTTYNGFGDVVVFKLNFTSIFPPTVIDLTISKSPITRTNTVYLFSNAIDIEDLEKNLTPFFEYRDLNNQAWNETYFSNLQYNNSRWELSFTPPKNAVLGLYDFRVCFNDTGMLFSNWFYLNDSLRVLNNFPIVIDSLLSINTSIQNETIFVWVNGSDVEDEEENLTIKLMYRDPNEQSWNVTYVDTPKYINNRWKINFSTPFDAPFGYYDFKVRVNDCDGNYSQWLYKNDSLLIYNLNPEVIDIGLSKNIIYRIESVVLYVNGTDYETSEPMLNFIGQYKSELGVNWENLTGSYINNRWQATFIPSKDATLGIYDFRARFKDMNNCVSKLLYLNDSLLVLNNIPVVEDLILSKNTAILSDIISIWINGSDVEEPEENLTIKLEYRDSNEQSWDTTYLDSPKYFNDRWEYSFSILFDAPFGYYDFRTRCNDSDGNYSDWLYLNDSLVVYNTGPNVIDMKISDDTVLRTNSVFLNVNGTDHETPESMLKFYVQYKPDSNNDWADLIEEYSNSNNNWEADFITTTESILGFYDFRVKFEDNESASSGWIYLNDSLEVLNNLPIIENIDSSEPSVFRTDSIIIYMNGTDIENPENLLTCEIQYKSPSGIWMGLESEIFKLDHWEVSFTPPLDAELGYYDLKVNFIDLDEDNSGWTIIEDAIEVKNNLPIISELCDDFEIDFYVKDFDLTPYGSDIEDSDEELIWSIDQTTVDTTLFSASIIGFSENILHIIAKDNVVGTDDVTLILTDRDRGSDTKSDITIYVNTPFYGVNISVTPALVEINQGKSENVILTIINKGKILENYNISFDSDEFTIIDIKLSKIFLSLGADDIEQITVIIIIPEDMETGEYKIKFIVHSDMASDNTTLTINVKEKSSEVKSEDGEQEDNTRLFISIGIIIIAIVIVVLILLFLFLKKKKQKEEVPIEEPPIEEEQLPEEQPLLEIPPEQLPTPEITPHVVPQPPVEELPPQVLQVEEQPQLMPTPQVEQPPQPQIELSEQPQQVTPVPTAEHHVEQPQPPLSEPQPEPQEPTEEELKRTSQELPNRPTVEPPVPEVVQPPYQPQSQNQPTLKSDQLNAGK